MNKKLENLTLKCYKLHEQTSEMILQEQYAIAADPLSIKKASYM